MIGASGIMRLAGAAERALLELAPVAIVEGILQQLAGALTTLREEEQLLLEEQPVVEDTGATAANRPNVSSTDIDELCALLETQNIAAVDKFSLLSASLSERVGAVRFDRLRDAIDNLDFHLGAELLRQALLHKGSLVPKADGVSVH